MSRWGIVREPGHTAMVGGGGTGQRRAEGVHYRRNSEPSWPLSDLEDPALQICSQQGECADRWLMDRLGQVAWVDEPNRYRLVLVWARVAFPRPNQEAHREAVRRVPVRIVDRVGVRLRQAPERDQVSCRDVDPRLLGKLIDRGAGEASTGLSGSRWQTPSPVIAALGQQDAAIVPFQGHHGTRHQDQLGADLLAQAPEV